jgi:salicylate hydroxylase
LQFLFTNSWKYAVALSQYPDIEVEIFEGSHKLAEVGAGIGLFPRKWETGGKSSAHQYDSRLLFITHAGPWEVIKKLHLEEDLLKATEMKPTEGPGISTGHAQRSSTLNRRLRVASFRYRKSDRPEGLEFYSLVTKGVSFV